MNRESCPELEALFEQFAEGAGPALEHSHSCEACSALLEEHRQLEKDLFRLADPLPPVDFVHQVMVKVAASPSPRHAELRMGAGIFAGTLLATVAAFVLGHGKFGLLGLRFANTAMHVRDVSIATSSAFGVVWSTAAIPVAALLTAMLFFSLVSLRRLAGLSFSEVKVSP